MSGSIPDSIANALLRAHSSWHAVLTKGVDAIAQSDPDYLSSLVTDHYLPTNGRLFAAFSLPLDQVRYVLIGEGPYPREESATGVCFMDGAVEGIWSNKGLSKSVNRATSLRNFIKMLLVAEGLLKIENTTGDAIAHVALKAQTLSSPFIQTLTELQANMTRHGFLLLNASLVYRPNVVPVKDAKAWRPFLDLIMTALAEDATLKNRNLPTLVLWGKIAEQLNGLRSSLMFPKAIAEHPYNLSFISNHSMQQLFGPMHLLHKTGC